jgi:hypothetical protein
LSGSTSTAAKHRRSSGVAPRLLGTVIDVETFERIVQERPRIAFSLLATVADRLAETSLLDH